MVNAGIWSLLPCALVVIVAYKKKNIFLGIGIGIFLTIIISVFVNLSQGNLSLAQTIFRIPRVLADQIFSPFNISVVIQVFVISGFASLLLIVDSFKVLMSRLSIHASNQRNVSIITWFMGILIFFDGIANMLIVGPLIKPFAKKVNLSKEKLAFIIDATSAPIAGIAVVSTWAGYEVALLAKVFADNAIDEKPLLIVLESLPYRFYNILMILFVIIIILMKFDFGPMRKYKTQEVDIVVNEERLDGKIRYAIIPIVILIGTLFFFMFFDGYLALKSKGAVIDFSLTSVIDMFGSADSINVLLLSSVLAFISIVFILKTKYKVKLKKQANIVLKGNKNILNIVFLLVLAWSFSALIKDIGIQEYLVSLLSNLDNIALLPLVIFLISSLTAFATGSSFATMGIVIPIAIGITTALDPNPLNLVIVLSAVLSGATFGDHCSPISDTTIISASTAECGTMRHVQTQFPYALFVGGFSVIGYILVAFSINIIVINIICILMMVLVMFLIRKNQKSR